MGSGTFLGGEKPAKPVKRSAAGHSSVRGEDLRICRGEPGGPRQSAGRSSLEGVTQAELHDARIARHLRFVRTLPADRFVFGAPRFTRFVALYASARNSREWPSLNGIATFLKIDKSELNSPGPIRMPRPVLPNVPGALMAKALVLNHCRILAALGRSPRTTDCRPGPRGPHRYR